MEIATEGRRAVVNAWTAPVTEQSESTASSAVGEETVAEDEDRAEVEADGQADEGKTPREDA